MSKCIRALIPVLMIAAGGTQAADKFPGIGRTATVAEIQAWDIDVRPDFKGLPSGSGTVASGQVVWDEKCASCHGTFGDSNEVFSPLVGGVTADDIKTGRVRALLEPVPRTTLMKVSSVSTLWDYINRAMPWNAPKSLSTDEVYAVLAYLLNLGDILPANFTLSDKTIREVQERLPNRNGKKTYAGLWMVNGKGDVQNVACMKSCPVEIGVASALPEFARDTHGKLADQQRPIGPTRVRENVKSAAPENTAADATAGHNVESVPRSGMVSIRELAQKNNCMACHLVDKKIVGPSFKDVAARYQGDAGAEAKLAEKVQKGGVGVWGAIPMPPNPVRDEASHALVKWILSGAPEK